MRDAHAYASQLEQLLPRGPAWDFAPDGPFAQLLLALGDEFARIDARGLDLLEEADARTALELLEDWERIAGLPDTCTGEPDGPHERQVAVHQKITGTGGQSRADFIELAATLGYRITIEEHRPFRMGARIDQPMNGADWAFAWTVRVRPFEGLFDARDFLSIFRMGSRMGTRLRGFGSLDIECVIRRAAPAHTHVFFAYEIEPEPVLWVDFTQ